MVVEWGFVGGTGALQKPVHAGLSAAQGSALFGHIRGTLADPELTSPVQLALRELQVLDSVLAEAARWVGVSVNDLDTIPGRAPRDMSAR
jgi:hypothetical protein